MGRGLSADSRHPVAPTVQASHTVRRRAGKTLLRVMPEGCPSRADLARWPHSLRPPGFYRTATLPFPWNARF